MRYIENSIKKDLLKKMVFVSGPRQCGKTTLAEAILKSSEKRGVYLNWDESEDRKTILKKTWSEDTWLIVLDEIHKYSKWKTWLKGTFDKTKDIHRFLVTGSARLDVYKKGGDSMLGRFHSWRLHPFCLAENPLSLNSEDCLRLLLERGGFPEPFLSTDAVDAKRWRRERRNLVLREDIRDLERVEDISLLDLLIDQLSTRVSGPIVMSNIAEDLQVASKTVKHWISILEKMYLVFSVKPYNKMLARALRKPPKLYFYDNGDVVSNDGGPRFENLVANHLLKRLHYLEDSRGDRYDLQYIRDKEGREVDFVILKDLKPVCLIEVKYSDESPSSSLSYYGDKLKINKKFQLVAHLKTSSVRNGISIVNAADWLSQPLDLVLW